MSKKMFGEMNLNFYVNVEDKETKELTAERINDYAINGFKVSIVDLNGMVNEIFPVDWEIEWVGDEDSLI